MVLQLNVWTLENVRIYCNQRGNLWIIMNLKLKSNVLSILDWKENYVSKL